RRDHGISRPEDARGKKLATLPGTNSDYFMYEFFNKYKIAPGEVKIANMPPPEMVVAFAKGDIDGYFAWEPHIYYGQQQLGKEAIVFPPGDLYKGFNTVNMDPAFVKAHPEIVGKILKALLKGEDFLNQHPDEALAIVCNRLKVEPAVGKALWKETIYRVELDRDLPETMEKIGRWAKTKDNVSGELPHFRDFHARRRRLGGAVALGRLFAPFIAAPEPGPRVPSRHGPLRRTGFRLQSDGLPLERWHRARNPRRNPG